MKKKILILGCSGMLGHTLFFYLLSKKNLNIYGSTTDLKYFAKLKNNFKKKIICLNIRNILSLEKIIHQIKPNYVINCTGIIKQKINFTKSENVYFVNSIIPKFLNFMADVNNFKFLQISTDCIYIGRKGNYREIDPPDAKDLYGISKFFGEVKSYNSGTIRTSIIGPEIKNKISLLEWFLSQNKKTNGFENVYFSGFTTLELSKLIYRYFIIKNYLLNNLYHFSSKKISKYKLLCIIKIIYRKNIEIIKKKVTRIDRSLNSTLFKKKNRLKIKFNWEKMIIEMKKLKKKIDNKFYE